MLQYFRTFEGTVIDNNDPLALGRVKVSISEISWLDATSSPWVCPEYTHGIAVPPVDTKVVVYFMLGNISLPVYRGRTGIYKDNVPASYVGPNSVVLFEDDEYDPLTVVYFRKEKLIEITKGTDFKIALDIAGKTLKTEGNLTIEGAGQEIKMTDTSVTINGNLEVLK
jgi:hypothetical protein